MAQDAKHLGRYRIESVLGRGAMGVVYAAVDTRLGRRVAIKTVQRGFLADESTASDYAARFEREAQAAARLSHPNIVTIFDFGEQDGESYIVMEFIPGRELAQVIDSGERFTVQQTVTLIGELLDALGAAHAQGIVHRDVKPANVMLDATGHVKLADFGVARLADHAHDRTMPGTLVGTPSYMSPEQILGQAVGSRTDLFAVGVLLYQLLTGQKPFQGRSAFDMQKAILQSEPVPPSSVKPGVPAAFDGVVAHALAKRPEDRPADAAAFKRLLGAAWQSAQSAPAGRSGATDRAGVTVDPPARRRRWPRVAAGVAATAALATAGLVAWNAMRLPGEGDGPVQAAVPEATAAPAASAPVPLARAASAAVAPAASVSPVPPLPAPVMATTSPPAPVATMARPPVAGPAASPSPAAARPARGSEDVRTRNDPRCPELLMRMQLGDTLTPEQTTVFHTRCVR